MNPIKIGVVGLGLRISHLMSYFSNNDSRFSFTAYADPSPNDEIISKLSSLGLLPKKAYPDLKEMLANEELDLLMVGSPNHLHLEHTRLGLEAGLKVFTEKPVVVSEAQTLDMLDLVKTYGEHSILVGLVLRYSRHMRDMQDLLDDDVIGQPVLIQACEHLETDHGAFFMRDWRRYKKYTGGFMLEKCCHDLDLYNMMIGARASSVSSFGGRKIFVPENKPPTFATDDVYFRKKGGWASICNVFDSDADIIDFQNAIVQYENGATLAFSTSLSAPLEQRNFTVIGTKGMVKGDFVKGYLKAVDARTGEVLIDKNYADKNGNATAGHYGADLLMIEDIKRYLTEGVLLPVSIVDALRAGMLALKMDESRESNKLVDMNNVWSKFENFV